MKKLYDELSFEFSKQAIKKYSTSFSWGILVLKPRIRNAIYVNYKYYPVLFHKINKTRATKIVEERLRIPDTKKLLVTMCAYIQYKTAVY